VVELAGKEWTMAGVRATRVVLAGGAVIAASLIPAGVVVADGGNDLPQGSERVHLNPKQFSVHIDNRHLPMPPRTRWTYRETDAGEHFRVVVTVTTRTKRIANGVTARVVRDTVTRHGKVVEDTFDWYAQDRKGNVWYLGERTAEFRNGHVTSREGSWQAGVHGAQPGVVMPAHPADGMRYRQEFLKGQAEDNGEVLAAHEQVQVPYGHFTGAVLTRETTPLEPSVVEYKWYAPGVGPVLTFNGSGGAGQERLVSVQQVSAAAARAAGTARLGHAYP
jgi:hypothetical protein